MIITLPYPNMELMPNRKNGKHWKSPKEAKDKSFSDAFILAKQALIGKKFKQAKIHVTITFVQNDKRHRDLDNLVANGSTKAYLDAIARAIGVDDKYFAPLTADRDYSTQSATIIKLEQL